MSWENNAECIDLDESSSSTFYHPKLKKLHRRGGRKNIELVDGEESCEILTSGDIVSVTPINLHQ